MTEGEPQTNPNNAAAKESSISQNNAVDVSTSDIKFPLEGHQKDITKVMSAESSDFVFPDEGELSQEQKITDTDSPTSEKSEVVYSSLPPDLNIDVMARATKTTPTGYRFDVRKIDGKLRITHHGDMHSLIHHRDKESPCIACSRPIGKNELFLNFPDDLDRRRLWGNALGFKYNEILRLRMATGYSITSIGHICTDHFSEECFRKYNFNKAAIECFGMPLTYMSSNPGTPVKKRTPWDCTVCSFRCYSVAEMHSHLSDHAKLGKDDANVRQALFDKGITCPFCRRCTYGYKTLSGLQRHLQVEPTSHFYLKRIHEIAVKNCRSACLEPISEWSSWNESNVFYAYHGCDVPTRSPTKRAMISPATPPVEKKNRLENDSFSEDDCASSNKCNRQGRPAARKLDLSGEEPSTSCLTVKPHHSKTKLGSESSIEMSNQYVSRIKALLPPETIIDTESRDEFVVGNANNLAHALRLVTEEDGYQPDGLYLDDPYSESLSPHLEQRHFIARQRKTARQLESNEARLRLFGDSDVPKGYKKIDGPDGPRLIPANERKSWRERFAPDVLITNRRFLPLN